MKIGIDVRFALKSRRGIGNYILQLVKHLAAIDSDNFYILYSDCDDELEVLPKQNNIALSVLKPKFYPAWEQFCLPLAASKDKLDILHCPANTAPIALNSSLVMTIHDVMYLKSYREVPKPISLYHKLTRLYYRAVVPLAARHASNVITVSEFSKMDIATHFPLYPKSSIVPTYQSIDERFKVLDTDNAKRTVSNEFDIQNSYFLALGALDPRKNTELVIQVFAELKQHNCIEGSLVITGVSSSHHKYFQDIAVKLGIGDDVILLGFTSVDQLVALYNGATLFLYPSLYEGFGIPPLESMACGTPVITSNLTSIPEIVEDAALLINPRDPEELKSAILKFINHPNLRSDYIDRGLKQVQKFSWYRMAKQTLDVYEKVARR
jgi:glycosyltransferase involved in cell wall biosynthesis